MPFAAGFLHIAIAIFFAVHAVRSGKDRYWLFVLFAFPLLGSIVYFVAEYLPTLHHTRSGRRAVRLVQDIVDPNRELREASAEFDRTPTAYNEARLARAHLAKGNADKAIEHYRHCASGPYASDASFLKGFAAALAEAGRGAEAAQTLERLFAAHPDQRRGDAAILHAESLSAAGSAEADVAFDSLIAADGSLEARCKYGRHLLTRGREAEARRAFEQVLADAKRGHHHSRELNQDWIREARTALDGMAG
jgi:hypothetical protein